MTRTPATRSPRSAHWSCVVSASKQWLSTSDRETAVQALLARRDDDGATPIRGVIHAAGVTEAQLLTEMIGDRLRRTMWPKIAGAQVLHEVFPPGSLDFLFLTASAGAVFGVPGQGAYASANAYLDGLARARHRQGCHTVSLDWVAWQGLGFAARCARRLYKSSNGWAHGRSVRPPKHSPPGSTSPAMTRSSRDGSDAVARRIGRRTSPTRIAISSAKAAWSQMPAERVRERIRERAADHPCPRTSIAGSEFNLDRPFAEMGLNSVMAMSDSTGGRDSSLVSSCRRRCCGTTRPSIR